MSPLTDDPSDPRLGRGVDEEPIGGQHEPGQERRVSRDPDVELEEFLDAYVAGAEPTVEVRRRMNMGRVYAGERRHRGKVEGPGSTGRRLSKDPGQAVARSNPR